MASPTSDPRFLALVAGQPLEFAIPQPGIIETPQQQAARTLSVDWLNQLKDSNEEIKSSVIITGAIIEGDLNWEHATLRRGVVFTACKFNGVVNLQFTKSLRNVIFRGCFFTQAALFRGIVIAGDLSIPTNILQAGINLTDAETSGILDANGSQFGNSAFQRMHIGKSAFFRQDVHGKLVTFHGDADFLNSHIEGSLEFDGTEFKQSLHLDGATIGGNLSLRTNQHVNRRTCLAGEFSATNTTIGRIATFEGAHFSGLCNLTGTKIGSAALCGVDKFGNSTIFAGDLRMLATSISAYADFEGAQFTSDAYFDGMRVGDSLLFRTHPTGGRVQFAGLSRFINVQVQKNAEFLGVEFKGKCHFDRMGIGESALFNSDTAGNRTSFHQNARFFCLDCRVNAEFRGSEFLAEADFESAHVAGNALFGPDDLKQHTIFKGDAKFFNAKFAQARFDGATFELKADFERFSTEGFLTFGPSDVGQRCSFGGEVRFLHAKISSTLSFEGAQFKNKADFDQTECGSYLFFRTDKYGNRTVFEAEARFLGATVGGALEFDGARFDGPANFDRLQVQGYTFFRDDRMGNPAEFKTACLFLNAKFNGPVEFSGAHFNNITFSSCAFESTATFASAAFDGNCLFDNTHFANLADFRALTFSSSVAFTGSRFQRGARFDLAQFHGPASFAGLTAESGIHFSGSTFHDKVNFRDARLQLLFLGIPTAEPSQHRWRVWKKQTLISSTTRFLRTVDLRGLTYERIYTDLDSLSPKIAPLDRQPYSQLERVFRNSGADQMATKVYLERRSRERKEKFGLRTLHLWAADWLYRLIANYGVRPFQLGILAVMVLAISTVIFSQPGALENKRAQGTPSSSTTVQPSKAIAIAMSLKYFLPMDVPLAQNWTPSAKLFTWSRPVTLSISADWCATLVRVMGSILVGLAIAALTGLLRRIAP
jgi:hypothetical protein